MNLVRFAISKPVTVAVGVILLTLFGLLSLFRIPIQLTPNVDNAEISITTNWTGASPVEVEREITESQEEELKNLEGLTEIESESRDGQAYVHLQFEIGTDTDQALLRTSNSLDRVKQYPDDAEKPIIKSGGRHESAIAWMIVRSLDGYTGNINEEFDFFDDNVKPRLERITGVSSVNIYGGRERELQVVVDPDAMAARRVSMGELFNALQVENKNISAGDFDEGKRRYIARTVGEYQSPEDVENVIVKRVDTAPVYVRDVAKARLGFADPEVVVRHEGHPTLVMNAVREPGSNVLVVMNHIKQTLAELNKGILAEHPPGHRAGV